MPELDAENEQQYRETMVALRVSRAQNDEIERLKQENGKPSTDRKQTLIANNTFASPIKTN